MGGLLNRLSEVLSAGSYHVPFCGYLFVGLESENHKAGHPKTGVWYEPTGGIDDRNPACLYMYAHPSNHGSIVCSV